MQRKADTHSKKARGSNAVRLFGFLLACTVLVPAASTKAHAQSATPPLYEQMEPPGAPSALSPPSVSSPVSSQPLPLTPSAASGAPSAQASSELRIQQLESEFRTMTGKQEETGHQLQLLQQSMDQIMARLTAIEQKQAAAPAAPAPVPATPDANAPSPVSSGGMPPQPAAAPVSATGALTQPDLAPPASDRFTGGTAGSNTSSNPSSSTLGTLTQPKGGSVTTAATPLTPPSRAAADTPDKAYEDAFALFTAKKYDDAEAAFQAFLAKYPKHPLAANAQFWIGESQYARGQYDKSAKAFAIAYQNYPQGPKGADSLLKLGMSLSGLGKTNEACLTWAQLKKQFPSAGPVLTRAASESQKNACKG